MPGYGKVILYQSDTTVNEGQDPQFSWMHTQTDTQSFDDFLRFASNVPNLDDENRALVVLLLKRAQKNLTGSSEPHCVMRCVGTDSAPDHTEKSAIFLRLPYYSTQKMDAAQSSRKSSYSTRSLLQYFYNLESTRNRDMQQVIRKLGGFPKGHIVHVSELWAVIVNFQFIITSAPIPLMDGASPSLEIISPSTTQSSSPSNICIINPDQHTVYRRSKATIMGTTLIKTICMGVSMKTMRMSLTGMNLGRMNLARMNLARMNLAGMNLAGMNLVRMNLVRMNLAGMNLVRMNLARMNLARMNLVRMNLVRMNLVRMNLAGMNLVRMNLVRMNLARMNLVRMNLAGMNLVCMSLVSMNPVGTGTIATEAPKDWIKLTTSCASALLRIHIQTIIPESSAERRGKEKEGKTRRNPVYSEGLSKAQGGELNQSVTDKQDQSENNLDPPETDRQAQPEIDEDERDLHKTEEPTDDSQSDWDNRYRKSNETGYTGARHSSRRHASVQSLTSTPGVVINQRPPGDDEASASPKIYFEPTKPLLSCNTSFAEQGILPKPADVQGKADYGRRCTKSESLAGNSSPSAPPHPPTINLEFPPVFTWQTRKSHTSLDNTSPNHLTSNVPSIYEPPEPLSMDEETIKHVSAHINNELLEPANEFGREIYRQATTKSYFDVDWAVTQRYAVSLPTLIAEHAETVPDSLSSEAASLKDVVIRLCRLFSFFAPLSYPCAVSDKFWGAVHDLLTTIPQYWDIPNKQEPGNRTRHHRMPETFFVANAGTTNYADSQDNRDLDELALHVGDCSKCAASRQYSTRSDAVDHLFTHISAAFPDQRSVNSSQSRWVMDFGEYMTYVCRNDDRIIIRELHDFLRSLEKMAAQIQHGVSASGEFDWKTYRIPSSLVDAFQDVLMMVVKSAHLVKSSHKKRETYTGPSPVSTFLISSEVDGVTDAGTKAETCMESAMRDIVLMTYTDELADVVTYEAVGPGLALALIMGDVRSRDSQSNPVNLLEIYREYVRTLQFKVTQNPHRRLLQEIYLVREELEIIQKASERQRLVLANYLSVINPRSFRITTESRISSFELEKARVNKLISQLNTELGGISLLNVKLDSLANQTRSGIDVRQEDQGKAILVFTIVTVVFMPLSFVTSYLGMNTNDIRNMASSQTLFWTISAPLTVGIITIVLAVAFQIDRIRELFDAFWAYDSSLVARSGPAVLRREGTGNHIEKLSRLSTPKNWVTKGWPVGRKTEHDSSMGV
ncbi:hypothetical protein PENCOP_c003G02763 [Penicillium coprophilum]|uniref:Mg2+ transporter protein, CorA-like/Zinc transport protein ZntB n=1 Tax=Penicillium coprophilum TaxID=36646 RepID=A0A1V6UYB7_9EURO|nr:hypothetical protein PENCOP_c003G02763 [Penicillium coprophilum]